MNIILASSSPRRKQLLSLLDIDFSTLSVDIDETRQQDETPTNYIKPMVAEKSEACMALLKTSEQSTCTLIITADTIGVLPNGQDVLLKPKNQEDAYAMWQQMSASSHYVWTAVQACLIDESARICWQEQILESTTVNFVKLTESDMQTYWQTGEPLDKAGGYAIQGKAAAWVERIDGSYTNVVGLPLAQTKQLLDRAQCHV